MTHQTVDCIIIGGGLVGALLGLSLSQAGFQVVVLERQRTEDILEVRQDGRVSAIAYGAQQFFSTLGIWDALKDQACPIHHIRVSDHQNPAFVHFTAQEAGIPALGYMVENRALRQVLVQACQQSPTLQWEAPVSVREVKTQEFAGQVWLEDGRVWQAPLIVGAEGRESSSRLQMGIPVRKWSYNQTAIVAKIGHTLDHERVAHEHFRPEGPLALLPLSNPYESSLVWSVPPRQAEILGALAPEDFNQELMKAFGPFLGDLHLLGQRWQYPLGGQLSRHFKSLRFALVGDAAHAMHPVAGQGLNVGIYDVQVLSQLIQEAAQLGLDWGSVPLLSRYEKKRLPDVLAFLASTHGVVHLFSSSSGILRRVRQLGMNLVHHLPFVKEKMVQRASRF